MSKFDDYFSEPQYFTHGAYVLNGSFTREEAAEMLSEYTGDEIDPEALEQDRVRFGFAPENVEDMHGLACWYTGAGNGKGTKSVWVYG